MEPCANSPCNNIAEVDKTLEAPFSMTSTISRSKRVIRICSVCNEHDKRMKELER